MGKDVPEIDVGVVYFIEEAHGGTLVGVLIRQVQIDHPVALLVGRIRRS